VSVDIEAGKFVDIMLPAEKLVEYFGPESFDIEISTELLEHVQNWRLVINNMKSVLKYGEYIRIVYCNLLDIKISLIVRKYVSQETINILSFKCGIMKESHVWTGPSECDEHSPAREKDLENIWSDLASARGFTETYPLLAPAIDLFREALSCYQNGAYMATAIMCRASSETAVYLLTTRYIAGLWEKSKMVQKMEIDYNLIQARWRRILYKAKASGYINNKLEQQLNKIREAGNFAVHYGQRHDDELRDLTTKVKKEIKGWIKREDALQTLHRTARILKEFMGKILDKYNVLIESQH
jgi:hypothetical protein